MNSIHITTAFRMLNSGKPVDLSCWTQKGEIRHYKDCVSLRYDTRTGVRNIKLLDSRQIRKIRDCCIFKINDMEVYL